MSPRWLALTVLTVARVSMGFQFQSLGTLAPRLMRELGFDATLVGSLIGLYVFPGLVLAMAGAMLGRRFGDRRVVACGLLLMVVGGVLPGLWPSLPVLVAGRLLSGIGGVLLNVVMTKMVTDWFAGGRIELAMAIYANSYPIGIGLALLVLGPVADRAGWPAAMDATAAAAFLALLVLLGVCPVHANDRPAPAASGPRPTILAAEATLTCLAGIMWGMSNAAFSIMVGFAPLLLHAHGLTTAEVGLLLSLPTWLLVASVQLGGVLEDAWPRPSLLVVLGCAVPGLALLLLPVAAPLPAVVALGLTAGLPVGVMLSLPGGVLRPEHRSLGMGMFYTCMYAGLAGLPALAGWLQDQVGSEATAVDFAGALFLMVLVLYGVFRLATRSRPAPVPVQPR
jgi:cyanate permease